ncbi:MAG: hypothetical protein CM15mP127_15400 [Gammaproteobacteria bacterium]|nr:MAG: hypothetical protein CM15mP127_15400 [Gammaproteobacteria bacterium]
MKHLKVQIVLLSYTNLTYQSDQVSEGSMALKIDYGAHNIEGWGGMQKSIITILM